MAYRGYGNVQYIRTCLHPPDWPIQQCGCLQGQLWKEEEERKKKITRKIEDKVFEYPHMAIKQGTGFDTYKHFLSLTHLSELREGTGALLDNNRDNFVVWQ